MNIQRTFLPVVLLISASLPTFSQGRLEDYQRAQEFLPGNVRHKIASGDVNPNWIGKSNRFWYRRAVKNQSEFLLVDAEHNTAAPAFDQSKLATALSAAAHHEYKAMDLPFDSIDFVDNDKAIQFQVGPAQWTCKLENYECKSDEPKPESAFEQLSPDKHWAAVVKDHNLYVRNTSTGTLMQLTDDGIAGYDYATPLPMLGTLVEQQTDNPRQTASVFWSPDSSKLVTYRIDSRNAGRFTSLQFVPPHQIRPKAFNYVYPLPGEVLPKAQPIIFDILQGKRTEVKTAPLDILFVGGPGFEWKEDNKHFYYHFEARGYKAQEVRMVDVETGEQKVLIGEYAETYSDPGESFFKFIDSSNEALWTSERDGWNHIYLYSLKTGQVVAQLTQGPWVVRGIEYVDEKARKVYFTASGKEKNEDPYLVHLYSVGLDGKGVTLLSPGNADHSVSLSPDGAFFVDSFSRADLPTESVLCRTKDGSEVRKLEKADISELEKMGWKAPEPFQGKAADGATDLYGLIWRPSNFDASKKYPIVEAVYTGPQGFFVPKTFSGGNWGQQSVAELGFIVVMVDGRGTLGRSRKFHEFSYRNLGGAFEDHVAMIKQMAQKYPYMDATRVGIFGTSAGGYGAAHALLVFPDFYKVGVSTSGDHDARLDKAWWNEVYQGYPVQDDYVAQSNITMARKLQGHLLIEHGDIDDNVNPVETMRFVDALMKANRNFDMLLVPNMSHGEGGNTYLIRRRWDYFVQNLLGGTPPKDFELKMEAISRTRPRHRR